MTIRKGETWGETRPLDADGVVVRSDAEARAVLEASRRRDEPFPPLGLLGGDLCRTLAGPGDEQRLRSERAVSFTVDLGEVLVDGRVHYFCAHVLAHTRLWSQVFLAMNAQWVGDLNLGPRAHPNDGRLDVYEARLSPRQLLAVRARARAGAHLPHPSIHERRTDALQIAFGRPRSVWLDGERIGSARNLSLRVRPDALTVVV